MSLFDVKNGILASLYVVLIELSELLEINDYCFDFMIIILAMASDTISKKLLYYYNDIYYRVYFKFRR